MESQNNDFNDDSDNTHTRGPRPFALPVNEAGIPDELKRVPQWLCWRWEKRKTGDAEPKWTKPPFNPKTGKYASTNDPSACVPYECAIAAYRSGDWDGIGFVFTPDDPYVGIDLDNCRDLSEGSLFTKPMELVRSFDSYTEVSPSDTGVKIIVRGALPGNGGKNRQLEMYDRARYFTLTGNVLDGVSPDIEERQEAVMALYDRAFAKSERPRSKPSGNNGGKRATAEDIDGKALWEEIAPNLKSYLYQIAMGKNANRYGKAYHSGSDADMALLDALAEEGLDEEQVVATFFATPRGDLAIDRYGEDDAYRRIERYGAPKAVVRAGLLDDDPPTNVRPIRSEISDLLAVEGPPPLHSRFTLLSGEAILNQPRPVFLVEGILVEGTLSAMIGKEATYKSFIVLDMALSIATGEPFQGHPVKRGDVVYVAGEGSGGIRNRIDAWMRQHDCALPDTFHLLSEAVYLLQEGEVKELINAVDALPEKPKLVIVDTLARAIQGGDENSAKDMGSLISACDALRTTFGAHILLVHHENKKGGIRGSTSLPGAIDTGIDIDRDGEIVTLTCSKQKDSDHFPDITLMRQIVELGDGGSSLVFTRTDKKPTSPKGKTEQVLAVLIEDFDDDGTTASTWEKACNERGIASSVFYEAKKELLNEGKVHALGRTGARGTRFIVTGGEGGKSHHSVTPSHSTLTPYRSKEIRSITPLHSAPL